METQAARAKRTPTHKETLDIKKMEDKPWIIKGIDNTWSIADDEAEVLYNLAKEAEQNIMEIGTFKGRSAVILSKGAKAGKGATVMSVDSFRMNGGSADQAVENIKREGADVMVLHMSSYEAARRYKGKDIGLLFIDAVHTYGDVLEDYNLWEPHLLHKAAVAFHDYSNPGFPGVKRAVDQILQEHPEWKPLQTRNWLAYTFRI
jgi:predicted O-methyltransferase YrrM